MLGLVGHQEWPNVLTRKPKSSLPGHGGPDIVRFTCQAAVNVVALLSTVGNVVLEKNVQGFWRAGLNWLAGWMRLVSPGLQSNKNVFKL